MSKTEPIETGQRLTIAPPLGGELTVEPFGGKHTIRTSDVAKFLGAGLWAGRRLLLELEAAGLKRKGQGRATHYVTREFLALYDAIDKRP